MTHSTTIDRHFGKAIRECEVTIPPDEGFRAPRYTKKKIVEPGRTYILKFYPILSRVSDKDMYKFLCKQNAIFMNLFPISREIKSPEFRSRMKIHFNYYAELPNWSWPWNWTCSLGIIRADVVTKELPGGRYNAQNCLLGVYEK